MAKYLVCVTGASGSIYGVRLMKFLAEAGHEVHAVASEWGARVTEHETGRSFDTWVREIGIPRENVHAPGNLAAPPASGTFRLDAAIIAPCSMSSAGAIASGGGSNLVHRAALVALKEGWPLALVPRETPLSLLSLRCLCTLAEAGAIVIPASPAFYQLPQSMDDMIDFVIAKILDRFSIPHNLDMKWKGMKREHSPMSE
jgi:4-hydroxy-3-polyprenylbenzoate decarboxylase